MTSSPAAPDKTARNGLIEIVRYVGAVGIVWFHLHGPQAWIGHTALIVFIVLSVNFALMQKAPTWGRTRVLELWAVWSVVYFFMKIGQSVIAGQPVFSEFEPWMLLTGPVLPLWFLPFIYVANGVASTYNTRVSLPVPWVEGIGLSAIVVGCLAVLQLSPGVPFSQWCIGVAAVCLAVAVFRARQDRTALGVVLVTLGAAVVSGELEQARLLLAAAPVAAWVLLAAPVWRSALAETLGGLALPVYILHPGVDAVLSILLPGLPVVVGIGLVVVVATGLGVLLQRTPWVRRFI